MKILASQTDRRQIKESFRKSFFNRKKEIVRIEERHIPCYLFELLFRSSRRERRIHVVCDALRGKVRRVDWPQAFVPELELSDGAALDEAQALKRVGDEFRWFSFSSGLRVRRKYHLEEVVSRGKLAYPFWVIYYRKKERYNFSVFDAISGKREDFFTREIFLDLFGLKRRVT